MLLMAGLVLVTPMTMPDCAKWVSLQWRREPAKGAYQSDKHADASESQSRGKKCMLCAMSYASVKNDH